MGQDNPTGQGGTRGRQQPDKTLPICPVLEWVGWQSWGPWLGPPWVSASPQPWPASHTKPVSDGAATRLPEHFPCHIKARPGCHRWYAEQLDSPLALTVSPSPLLQPCSWDSHVPEQPRDQHRALRACTGVSAGQGTWGTWGVTGPACSSPAYLWCLQPGSCCGVTPSSCAAQRRHSQWMPGGVSPSLRSPEEMGQIHHALRVPLSPCQSLSTGLAGGACRGWQWPLLPGSCRILV